jgi:hypothetical protein
MLATDPNASDGAAVTDGNAAWNAIDLNRPGWGDDAYTGGLPQLGGIGGLSPDLGQQVGRAMLAGVLGQDPSTVDPGARRFLNTVTLPLTTPSYPQVGLLEPLDGFPSVATASSQEQLSFALASADSGDSNLHNDFSGGQLFGLGGNNQQSAGATSQSNSPFNIDFNYIAANEGGSHLNAYNLNPVSKFPNSGVTVAGGVDLGQQSEANLNHWGLSKAQVSSLRPYLGLRGQSAINYLKQNPLSIDASEANMLNSGAINYIAKEVEKAFNDASEKLNFSDLPASEQTVLADIAYQHGVGSLTDNLRTGASFTQGAFWNAIINNDINAAVKYLSKDALPGSPDHKYAARIINDARLLKNGN